jgi:hypothetical protein
MEKCLLKRPTKISFRSASVSGDSGSLSHRRRSNVNLDDSVMSVVIVEDLKLGE